MATVTWAGGLLWPIAVLSERATMDWLLIIIAIIVAFLVVGMNIMLMITYSHPEDKNQAFLAKLIVVSPAPCQSAPPVVEVTTLHARRRLSLCYAAAYALAIGSTATQTNC